MDVIKVDTSSACVRLIESDLIILANAINEAQAAIEDWEFSTRMGGEPSEAEALRRKLSALLDLMKKASP